MGKPCEMGVALEDGADGAAGLVLQAVGPADGGVQRERRLGDVGAAVAAGRAGEGVGEGGGTGDGDGERAVQGGLRRALYDDGRAGGEAVGDGGGDGGGGAGDADAGDRQLPGGIVVVHYVPVGVDHRSEVAVVFAAGHEVIIVLNRRRGGSVHRATDGLVLHRELLQVVVCLLHLVDDGGGAGVGVGGLLVGEAGVVEGVAEGEDRAVDAGAEGAASFFNSSYVVSSGPLFLIPRAAKPG
jgi:hypothetical protein